jgi:hypothetical protein
MILGGLLGTSACAPKIGDKCTASTDCSAQGDRLCDPTQPDGYCTIFNCEPNRCPDEAVCVAFVEPSCSSPAVSMRFQRTFCMFVCESNNDCRAGYQCLDTTGDPARQVVDESPQSRKICTVPTTGSMPMANPNPAVCLSPDAGAAPEAGADASTDAPEASPDAADAGSSIDALGADAPETGD